MADELRADLTLELSEALRAVDSLRSDIEDALRGAAGSFEEEFGRITGSLPTVEIEADAGAVAPAIEEAVSGADTTVPVEGEGFDQLTLGIDEAVAATTPVVTVEADVGPAEDAIEGLGETASQAGGQVSGLTQSVGPQGLGSAAGLATGSVSGLGSAVGGLGGNAAAAVGLVGGLGAVVGLMFNEATDALGATQRFNGVLGDMAGQVENLRSIEGLNTNLGDLALTLGSDDDKIRTVAARLFELARSSGVAKGDASLFTQQMIAMGARAVALNPELGDVGDVTDSLSSAFVRGGKFAAKYGLDLNQNLITDRAVEMTGKLESELTFVDKAMAGAAIASEKYGGNLAKVVAEGSENAITKQRRLKQTVVENIEALGAPLVAPVFLLMEQAIPITEDLGRVVALLARGALPILSAALEVATPVLELVVDALEAIPAPIVAVVAAMLLFRKAVGPEGATGLLRSFAGEAASLPDQIGRAVVGLGLLKMGFDQAGESGVQGAVGVAQMAAGGAALGSVFGPQGAVIGGVAGAVAGLTRHMIGGGESADEFADRIGKLSRELRSMSDNRAATEFLRQVRDGLNLDLATGKVTANVSSIRKELEQLARVDPGQAQRVFATIVENAKEIGLSAKEIDRLRDAVVEGSTAYGRHADKARQAAEANREIAAAADTSATAYDRARAAADVYRASLEQLDAGHTSVFQAETEAAQSAAALAEAWVAAKGSLDPFTEAGSALRGSLADAANNARTYSAAILEAGGSSEAARVPLQNTTNQIAELARTSGASPEDIAKLLNSLGLITFASPEVQAAAAAMGFKVEGIGTSAQTAAGDVAAGMGAAEGAVTGSNIAGAAGAQGKAVVDQFGNPIKTGMPGAAGEAIDSVGQVIDKQSLKDQAWQAGHSVGRQFGLGVASGIEGRASVAAVAEAAAQLVRDAEAAARAEARSKSPSRLFAELGEDLALGTAMGFDAGAADVVRAAEDVVRAAASVLARPPERTAAEAAMGMTGPASYEFNIEVHGVTDPGVGRAVGQEIAAGINESLARRNAMLTARTGGS